MTHYTCILIRSRGETKEERVQVELDANNDGEMLRLLRLRERDLGLLWG